MRFSPGERDLVHASNTNFTSEAHLTPPTESGTTVFLGSIPNPTSILTRKVRAEDLTDPELDHVSFSIEVDEIDGPRGVATRSLLVSKVTDSYVQDRIPQNVIEVSFAHPDVKDRTLNLDDVVTLHEFDYEHVV